MRANFPLALLAAALSIGSTSALGADSQDMGEPIATVGGRSIYEKELQPMIQASMRQLQNREYQIKSTALDNLINQRLLAAAAKERSITVDELLRLEVNAKIDEPTEAELQAYYASQKDRQRRTFDEVKLQLQETVRKIKLQRAQDLYVEGLRRQARVAILLPAPRVDVTYDAARLRGSADAAVTIVEFSDFQCPYCKPAESTVTTVLAKYGNAVRLAYRDFPLTHIHPQAALAAEASRCAGDQGRFWAYHDVLFNEQSRLDAASLVRYARNLEMDGERFERCLSSGQFRDAVERDMQEGFQIGITGTPAFFINGVALSGAQPFDSFVRLIDQELARLPAAASTGTSDPANKAATATAESTARR